MEQTSSYDVSCGKCGVLLDEPAGTEVDVRTPCQRCGSTARCIGAHIEGSVHTATQMKGLHERQGEAVGFRETPHIGRSSESGIDRDGVVEVVIRGSSSQGEEDTLGACHLLLERLNTEGASFTEVIAGAEPADGILHDPKNPKADLAVQVVRAVASQSLWRELSFSNEIHRELAIKAIVGELRDSIQHKLRIQQYQRKSLALVLDATRIPGFAFDSVVREFRLTWADWATAHGFIGIWLVGPLPRLVWRLDKSLETSDE